MTIRTSLAAPLVFLMFLSVPFAARKELVPGAKLPEGPPPAASPWRDQHFNAPAERLRAELRALLSEDHLALREEGNEDGTFHTDLVEFDKKKFGVDVSIPPPKSSPEFPYYTTNTLESGRFGFEGKIVPERSNQSHLHLRALREGRAMDKRAGARRWLPRASNGEVERNYFTRLALRLLRPPAAGASTPR